MSQRLNPALRCQVPSNLQGLVAKISADVHMRILRRSVVSVQGHDLSPSDAIALMDPYAIEMGVHHYESVRSFEFNVSRRRLPRRTWSVGCAIGRDLQDKSIEGSVDLDMPAIPIFVLSAVCLVEAHEPIGRSEATDYKAIRP